MKNLELIIEFLKNTSDLIEIKQQLSPLHPYDLATLLKYADTEEKIKIYAVFNDEELGNILSFIDSDDAAELIEDLNNFQIASIINTMEPDDATAIIKELEEDKQSEIIELLDDVQKQDVEDLAEYYEDTAGAMMTKNYISILSGSDIKLIMKEIVAKAPDVETINTSFVIDKEGKLLGTLDLKKIIVTKSPKVVNDIMNANFKYVEASDSYEHTIDIIKKYDIYELPVLEDGILKGIITMDDAYDAYFEETEDNYIKFAAVSEVDKTEDSTLLSIKKRLPWLALLLILDILISLVISKFDYIFEVDALTILVIFQPIILGLTGNCGTQSLGVTIRQLANNQVNTNKKIIAHVSKEFLLGLFTGLVLGLISFLLVYLILKLNNVTDIKVIDVGITVSISLLVSIISANVSGAVIPIFFYKIKIDPASASGPLITTIIDIIAVVIYFTLATSLLYNKLI